MNTTLRQFATTLVAFVAGIAATLAAIIAIVDIDQLSIQSGLPVVAIMTPMIAVVVFWAVARVLGTPLQPARIFLFGGITMYTLLYVCGRLMAQGVLTSGESTVFGAVVLFALAFLAIRNSRAMT